MYDSTSKLLISQFCTDFTEWLLGEPIKLNEMQPTELYYEPIRADSVVLLKNDNLICHWEFQTNPDKYMVYRIWITMSDYSCCTPAANSCKQSSTYAKQPQN
jgi:predicted transposase YdaD